MIMHILILSIQHVKVEMELIEGKTFILVSIKIGISILIKPS